MRVLLQTLGLWEFRKKRAAFYTELAKSLDGKEQFRVFLQEELRIAKSKMTRNDSRAMALQSMLKKLSVGEQYQMSKILAEVMPQSDRLMLSALDDSKNKGKTLRALAQAIDEQKKAKSVILKAILPPLVLIPGVAGFAYVLSTKSIPVIAKIAPPQVWTPYNQAVRDAADLVANQGFMLMLSGALLLTVFLLSLPRWTGALRDRLERTPKKVAMILFPVFPFVLPLTIYRDFQVAQMMSSLAVLLESGRTLTDSLRLLTMNASPWMRSHLRKVLVHLTHAPTDYLPAFSRGLLSPSLLARLATTIRIQPKFDRILIQLGTEGADQIRSEIELTAKSLNFVFMIICASLVLFFYMGQFSISQSMSDALDPMNKARERLK